MKVELINKAKIRWQCRRGMLELDLLLGSFFEKYFDRLGDPQQQLFVQLLQEPDQYLYNHLIKNEISAAEGSFSIPSDSNKDYKEILHLIRTLQ